MPLFHKKYSGNCSWNRPGLFMLLAQDERYQYIHCATTLFPAGLRGKFELCDTKCEPHIARERVDANSEPECSI